MHRQSNKTPQKIIKSNGENTKTSQMTSEESITPLPSIPTVESKPYLTKSTSQQKILTDTDTLDQVGKFKKKNSVTNIEAIQRKGSFKNTFLTNGHVGSKNKPSKLTKQPVKKDEASPLLNSVILKNSKRNLLK